MLEPDTPDFAGWDSHAHRTLAHPILSSFSPNHSREQSLTSGEHHAYYTHGSTQFVDQRQGDKHALEVAPGFAVQRTPSSTSHINPNTFSSTPSISVLLPSDQSALPQQHKKVIMQEIPPSIRSKFPPKTPLSENVNANRARKSENHRRNMNEPSMYHFPVNNQPEVIDLTLSDEDHDERVVQMRTTMPPSSISRVESLFTPPPAKKRRRMIMDHVAVPSFQQGLTKADYLPISTSPTPIPPVAGGVQDTSVCDALGVAFNQNTDQQPLPEKGKDREREHISDLVLSPKPISRKRSKCVPPSLGADIDTTGNALIDAFYTQTILPLVDPDLIPSIFRNAVATSTRFVFARRWNKLTQVLKRDEIERVMNYHLYHEDGNRANSPDKVSIGFTLMDTGRGLQQEWPAWELVPPPNPPKNADVDKYQRAENTPAGSSPTWHDTSDFDSCSSSPTLERFETPPPPAGVLGVDADVDMNQYLNCLSDSPSKQLSPSREGHAVTPAFRLQTPQPAGSSYPGRHSVDPSQYTIDPTLIRQSVERDGFLGVPPSPGVTDSNHPPDSIPLPPSLTDDRNIDGNTLLGFREDNPPSPWAEVGFEQGATSSGTPYPEDAISPVESGTIDPSLLGGQQAVPVQRPSPKARKGKPRQALPEPIIYVRRRQDALSLPWMRGGKRSVRIKFREREHSPSDQDEELTVVVPHDSTQNDTTSSEQDLGDPDWVQNQGGPPSEHKRKSTGIRIRMSRTSIARVDSDTDSSFVPSVATSTAAIWSKEKCVGGSREHMKGTTNKTSDGPDKTEKTSCHQCRNTTNRPKMQCSNDIGNGRTCGKRFCQRCIQRRYPEITFDESSCSFLCPSCTNTCNCSFCSRRRGEEFISMRTDAFVGPRIQSRLTFVRDSAPAPLDAPPRDSVDTSRTSSETPNFWAYVYGLEGEHLGSAYWNQASSRSSTVNRKKVQKPPKVFIGHPQRSWKVRSTRDLEPMSENVTVFIKSLGNQGKGKGKAVNHSLRLFIGNPTALHESFKPMPRTPSLILSRSSSPNMDDDTLSHLEAYWPQPEVGECCSWEPPPPLVAERSVSSALPDEEVARAIHVALAALS